MKSRWIIGIAFWVLLILSVVFYEHHRWIDGVWIMAIWVIMLGTALNSVIQFARKRHERAGLSSFRGYPGWFIRFALDDDVVRKAKPKAKG